MRLLLDTHALVWWVYGEARLSVKARAAVESPDSAVFVSAISALEVATKHRIGKMPSAAALAVDFEAVLARAGLQQLPVSVGQARLAGALDHPNRDPFDRVLMAQALSENLTLVSNEVSFAQAGVSLLW